MRSTCCIDRIVLVVCLVTLARARLEPKATTGGAHYQDKLPGWQGETFHASAVFSSGEGAGDGDASQQQGPHDVPGAGTTVEVVSWKPRVLMFRSFLTDAEVDYLIELSKPRLHKSMVADDQTGQLRLSTIRTSLSTFVARNETPVVAAIEDRVAAYSHLPPNHQEPMEVLRYEEGQKNENHYDSFRDATNTANGGQRVATMLLYLSDVEEGGETVFFTPDASRDVWSDGADCTAAATVVVRPVRGAALLFYNVDPSGSVDEQSLHGSCPVRRGVKWSATKWIRAERHYLPGEQMDPEMQGDPTQRQQQLLIKQALLLQQLQQLHAAQMEALMLATPELLEQAAEQQRRAAQEGLPGAWADGEGGGGGGGDDAAGDDVGGAAAA